MWWRKKAHERKFRWRPLADITAFELALAVGFMRMRFYSQAAAITEFEKQPTTVRRHFEEVQAHR